MGICLNMIVRNEAAVIRRCLDSVRPWITSWVIVDTGSVDGTQDVVKQHLEGVPGTLHQRLWVNEGFNRQEAFKLALESSPEYVLTIDADEVLARDPGATFPELGGDAYELTVRYNTLEYARLALVRGDAGCGWLADTVHSVMRAPDGVVPVRIDGFYVMPSPDGASWADPEKYQKHAAALEQQVAERPADTRARYYLAQSYRDAGMPSRALAAYRTRAVMSAGWVEETWSALYEAAKLTEELQHPYHEVFAAYVSACRARPQRAEPFFRLARYLRERGDFPLALMFAREAARLPRPPDRLFVEAGVYRTAALEELERLASCVGDDAEAHAARRELNVRTRPTSQGELQC